MDVLDAAVAQRCIDSYSTNGSPGNRELACIDGVCEHFRNGPRNSSVHAKWWTPDLEEFRASSGSEMVATYGIDVVAPCLCIP